MAVKLGEMAALLGETLDSEGIRQSLMAKELSDLPAESLDFALDCWKRGDKRHLSAYQQDVTRVGVFFPRPAELREIAQLHAAEQAERRRNKATLRQIEEYSQDRQEHPENYVSVADVLGEFFKTKGLEPPAKPVSAYCPHCNGVQLSALRPEDLRALADVMEKQARGA